MPAERLLAYNRILPRPVRERVAALALIAGLSQACGGQAPSPTPEITASPTPIVTEMPTAEPTITLVPSPTDSPTPEPTPSPTPTKSPSPTPTPIRGSGGSSGCGNTSEVLCHGPNDGKTVYFTFDDCWQTIDPVVQTLASNGAVGTFFCVGRVTQSQAGSMRAALSNGDELENHTFDHSPLSCPDVACMVNDINAQLQGLRTYVNPDLREWAVRPPGGSYNTNFLTAANNMHLKTVEWSIDSGGATVDPYNSSQARINLLLNTVNSGLFDRNGNLVGGQIILQHVRPADEAALPYLLKEIKDHGGRFGLIRDLIGGQGSIGPGPLPAPTASPSPSLSPEPSGSFSPSPSPTESVSPSPNPSPTLEPSPTSSPTLEPSPTESITPTPEPVSPSPTAIGNNEIFAKIEENQEYTLFNRLAV